MRRIKIIFVLFIVFSFSIKAQTINGHFFPKETQIDTAFKNEAQKCMTNPEIIALSYKYVEIWKKQMELELKRLSTVLSKKDFNKLRNNHQQWFKSIEEYVFMTYDVVVFHRVGRQPENEFGLSLQEIFRERAISYFCMYWTIKEQADPDFDYRQPFTLAK